MSICKNGGTSHHQVPQQIDDGAPLFGTSEALEEPVLLFVDNTDWPRGNKFGEKVVSWLGLEQMARSRRALSSNQSYR